MIGRVELVRMPSLLFKDYGNGNTPLPGADQLVGNQAGPVMPGWTGLEQVTGTDNALAGRPDPLNKRIQIVAVLEQGNGAG